MLLADEGRFVIISGNRLLGIDDECEGAIKAGCAVWYKIVLGEENTEGRPCALFSTRLGTK